ncbi:hypothetical protein AFLA_010842 [Aspergillus flavus NRRL3357]|nr:hypothetical protein AFLA_010842 [Aspergillus flavus NRRL3357]
MITWMAHVLFVGAKRRRVRKALSLCLSFEFHPSFELQQATNEIGIQSDIHVSTYDCLIVYLAQSKDKH